MNDMAASSQADFSKDGTMDAGESASIFAGGANRNIRTSTFGEGLYDCLVDFLASKNGSVRGQSSLIF